LMLGTADNVQIQPSEGAFVDGDKTKLDAAVQPGDDADTLGSGAATDGWVLTADGVGGAAWEALAGGGDMLAATYDAANVSEQLVGLTATQTLTNKTLTSPVLGGSVTGTFTIGGTPTLATDLVPDADGTRDVGSATNRIAVGHFDSIDLNGTTLDGTTLADPGADRGLGWDDSAGTTTYWTPGTGLSFDASFNLNLADALVDLATTGANSADGEFLVGTGAGALAWESGATARASMGAQWAQQPSAQTSSPAPKTSTASRSRGVSTRWSRRLARSPWPITRVT